MLYSFTLKFGALLEHTTAYGLTIYEVWDSFHQGSSARSEYTSNTCTVMLVMAEMVNIMHVYVELSNNVFVNRSTDKECWNGTKKFME